MVRWEVPPEHPHQPPAAPEPGDGAWPREIGIVGWLHDTGGG